MIRKIILFYFFILTTFIQPVQLFGINENLTEGLSEYQLERLGSFDLEKQAEFENCSDLISKGLDANTPPFYHILKEADSNKGILTLMDNSVWNLSSWYKGAIKNWETGDRLKIYYSGSFQSLKIENIDKKKTTWAEATSWSGTKQSETIYSLFTKKEESIFFRDKVSLKIGLTSGWIFQKNDIKWQKPWNRGDKLFILEVKSFFGSQSFVIFNTTQNQYIEGFSLVGYEKKFIPSREDILSLEKRLNARVISQENATRTVTDVLINSYSGLRDPNTPVGVFLFLGPTGVGKTELVKTISEELYKTQSRIIRFDMSQFNTSYSVSRLIGSDPGLVDSHDGGQLTNPLLAEPASIVLLDEMEKAHDEVRKFFLPVFDEGSLKDAQGHQVDATEALFFMTSNIASTDIIDLYNNNYDEDTILKMIEPQIIKTLSPELYNRAQPVIFRPLTEEAIASLVDLMLQKVIAQVKQTKDIDLTISHSVKKYLAEEGYHPLLGARPLKRLIQKKIIANISYAIIEQEIPNGTVIHLNYFPDESRWEVTVDSA